MSGGNKEFFEQLIQFIREENGRHIQVMKENLKLEVNVSKEEVNELKQVILNQNKKIDSLGKSYEEIRNKVEFVERTIKKNIVIFGLKVPEDKNIVEITLNQLNHLLRTKIKREQINNIRHIGKKYNKSNNFGGIYIFSLQARGTETL
ncbi:hypothetical protein JTB14_017161 [Gonioctena quinquepunctata]|nr:hypothetical protein JTB14_017161 [Gonioctena quinquepunctata]